MKIQSSGNDALYSKIIRAERPLCEVCKGQATQIHHYFGRRKQSVRFCDDNVVSCCFSCHRKFHEDPEFGRAFMLKKLGKNGFEILLLNSNFCRKTDHEMVAIFLKRRLKEKKGE